MVLATVDPAAECAHESLTTLGFASRCREASASIPLSEDKPKSLLPSPKEAKLQESLRESREAVGELMRVIAQVARGVEGEEELKAEEGAAGKEDLSVKGCLNRAKEVFVESAHSASTRRRLRRRWPAPGRPLPIPETSKFPAFL